MRNVLIQFALLIVSFAVAITAFGQPRALVDHHYPADWSMKISAGGTSCAVMTTHRKDGADDTKPNPNFANADRVEVDLACVQSLAPNAKIVVKK